MLQKGFAKIWLLVIAVVIIAAGVLVYQQWHAPAEKGQPSGEEAEAPQEEAQPPAGETTDGIHIGQIEVSNDVLSEIKEAVDAGHQPWRMEPEMVLGAEGLKYGFTEDELQTAKEISVSRSSGVARYEVMHRARSYEVMLFLFPLPMVEGSQIWFISEIRLQK